MKRQFKVIFSFLIVFSMFISMLPVSAETIKLYEDINLFTSGGGDGPKNTLSGEFAQKFTVPAGKQLEEVVFIACPTWTESDSSVDVLLYKWNQDYDTTVSGTVLGTHHETNHPDNSDMVCKFGKSFAAGDYLVVMDKASATNNIGTWTEKAIDGTTAFIDGVEADSWGAKARLRVSSSIDTDTYPFESVTRFDFSKAADVARVTNCLNITVSQENNLLVLTHEDSNDPGAHIVFEKAVNTQIYKYVALKIKKSAGTGTAGQLFYNVLGASADGKKVVGINYQDTAEWQNVIVDLNAINAGSVGYFRFDTFPTSKAGDTVLVESIRFFKTQAAAEASFSHPNPMTEDPMTLSVLIVIMLAAFTVLKKKIKV